jgi:hypothetical protein
MSIRRDRPYGGDKRHFAARRSTRPREGQVRFARLNISNEQTVITTA